MSKKIKVDIDTNMLINRFEFIRLLEQKNMMYIYNPETAVLKITDIEPSDIFVLGYYMGIVDGKEIVRSFFNKAKPLF